MTQLSTTALAPLCPARPDAWTDDMHTAAKAHAADAYPMEAVGIVERGCYVRLDNRSLTPDRDVLLDDADLVRAAQADVFFHSHPDGRGCPSETDMMYQQQLGIPFVIIVWPLYDVLWFGDSLAKAPLLGRGFRHGVHDCFSLCRDYYAEQGIVLPNPPRDWNWWGGPTPKNLYADSIEPNGFRRIAVSEATQPGDGLLMSFNYKVPMHAAIVIDRDLILHHPAGQREVDATRLSALVPRVRYLRHVAVAVRRK